MASREGEWRCDLQLHVNGPLWKADALYECIEAWIRSKRIKSPFDLQPHDIQIVNLICFVKKFEGLILFAKSGIYNCDQSWRDKSVFCQLEDFIKRLLRIWSPARQRVGICEPHQPKHLIIRQLQHCIELVNSFVIHLLFSIGLAQSIVGDNKVWIQFKRFSQLIDRLIELTGHCQNPPVPRVYD